MLAKLLTSSFDLLRGLPIVGGGVGRKFDGGVGAASLALAPSGPCALGRAGLTVGLGHCLTIRPHTPIVPGFEKRKKKKPEVLVFSLTKPRRHV